MTLIQQSHHEPRRFYGKYRGQVVANIDPLQKGRLLVQVVDVLGDLPSTWAMPCVPVAGIQAGMYAVPPVGSGVWVEFEQGDPDYPIWVGGFWGSAAEIPALALVPPPPPGQNILIQTTGQNTLSISDVPGPTGGILIKSMTGAFITVNDAGIIISNGKGATIVMAGPSVTINQGALVVT
jgi:uncharacterized protein involved in type VI secretion and phage assembly